jgi:hypothetical protein
MSPRNPSIPAESPWRRLVWRVRCLLWLAIVALAVLEGATVGWREGGVVGAINAGLAVAMLAPGFVLLGARRMRQEEPWSWWKGAGATIIEVLWGVLALLVALGLARAPGLIWPIMFGISVVAVGLLLIYLPVVTKEKRWAIRGAVLGAVFCGLLAAVVGRWLALRDRQPVADVLLMTLALPVPAVLVGAFVGSFVAAGVRADVRRLRQARIRVRGKRAREARGWDALNPHGKGLDLSDASLIAAAQSTRKQVLLLLLKALRDRVEGLHWESLGNVCRLVRESNGGMTEVMPLPIPAHQVAVEIASLATCTYVEPDGAWNGRLGVRLAGHWLPLLVRWQVTPWHTCGVVRLPADKDLAGQAGRVWNEYQEFVPDTWVPCPGLITLQRATPAQVEGRPPTTAGASWKGFAGPTPGRREQAVTLRLVYEGYRAGQSGRPVLVWVEFDGWLVGPASSQDGLSVPVAASVGNHLLQIRFIQRPVLDRSFGVRVLDPGVYEVRLRWSRRFWETYRLVADATERTQAVHA